MTSLSLGYRLLRALAACCRECDLNDARNRRTVEAGMSHAKFLDAAVVCSAVEDGMSHALYFDHVEWGASPLHDGLRPYWAGVCLAHLESLNERSEQ